MAGKESSSKCCEWDQCSSEQQFERMRSYKLRSLGYENIIFITLVHSLVTTTPDVSLGILLDVLV